MVQRRRSGTPRPLFRLDALGSGHDSAAERAATSLGRSRLLLCSVCRRIGSFTLLTSSLPAPLTRLDFAQMWADHQGQHLVRSGFQAPMGQESEESRDAMRAD